MGRKVTKEDCLAEIKRFFKYYSVYCKSADPDSVREVLASGYSVNDKVRKAGYPHFFDSNEFLAIKVIRNYAIHQAEIYNEAKALPLISTVPIQTDLNILCLLPKKVIDSIFDNTNEKGKSAIKSACIFYKKYVDIYPCIFNFGVQLFLYTENNDLEVESNDYQKFKKVIEYERRHKYPHYVKGGFSLPHGGDVDEFLESNLQTIDKRLEIQKVLYSEENGMYTFNGVESVN